jgi:hypothetical protein
LDRILRPRFRLVKAGRLGRNPSLALQACKGKTERAKRS